MPIRYLDDAPQEPVKTPAATGKVRYLDDAPVATGKIRYLDDAPAAPPKPKFVRPAAAVGGNTFSVTNGKVEQSNGVSPESADYMNQKDAEFAAQAKVNSAAVGQAQAEAVAVDLAKFKAERAGKEYTRGSGVDEFGNVNFTPTTYDQLTDPELREAMAAERKGGSFKTQSDILEDQRKASVKATAGDFRGELGRETDQTTGAMFQKGLLGRYAPSNIPTNDEEAFDQLGRLDNTNPLKREIEEQARLRVNQNPIVQPEEMTVRRSTAGELAATGARVASNAFFKPMEMASRVATQAFAPVGGAVEAVRGVAEPMERFYQSVRRSDGLNAASNTALDVLEVGGQLAIQVATGFAGGSAGFALSAMLPTMGQSYNNNFDLIIANGGTPEQANLWAMPTAFADGALEYLTSKIEFGFLKNNPLTQATAGKWLRNRFIGAFIEGGQEGTTGVGQEMTDALLRAGNAIEQIPLAERTDRVIAATVMGALVGSAMPIQSLSNRDAAAQKIRHLRTMAQQAKASGNLIAEQTLNVKADQENQSADAIVDAEIANMLAIRDQEFEQTVTNTAATFEAQNAAEKFTAEIAAQRSAFEAENAAKQFEIDLKNRQLEAKLRAMEAKAEVAEVKADVAERKVEEAKAKANPESFPVAPPEATSSSGEGFAPPAAVESLSEAPAVSNSVGDLKAARDEIAGRIARINGKYARIVDPRTGKVVQDEQFMSGDDMRRRDQYKARLAEVDGLIAQAEGTTKAPSSAKTKEAQEKTDRELTKNLMMAHLGGDPQEIKDAYTAAGYVEVNGLWVHKEVNPDFVRGLKPETIAKLKAAGIESITPSPKGAAGVAVRMTGAKQRSIGLSGDPVVGNDRDETIVHELGHLEWDKLSDAQRSEWSSRSRVTRHGQSIERGSGVYGEAYEKSDAAEEDFAQAYAEANGDLDAVLRGAAKSNQFSNTPLSTLPQGDANQGAVSNTEPEVVEPATTQEIDVFLDAEEVRAKKARAKLVKSGGLEHRRADGSLAATLTKSSKPGVKLQMTLFAVDGKPSADETYTSVDEAIRSFLSTNPSYFRRPDLPDDIGFGVEEGARFVYKSTQRPIGPGAVPSSGLVETRPDELYGQAVFNRPLFESELSQYDLVPIAYESPAIEPVNAAPTLEESPVEDVVDDQGESKPDDYHNGNAVKFTKINDDGFQEFVYLEGSKAGQAGMMWTKEERAKNDARKKAEYEDQQAGFRRVREAQERDQAAKKAWKNLTSQSGGAIVLIRVGDEYVTFGKDAADLKKIIGSDKIAKDEAEKKFKKIILSGRRVVVDDQGQPPSVVDVASDVATAATSSKEPQSDNGAMSEIDAVALGYKNGPLWHSTPNKFSSFDINKAENGALGRGIYFGSDQKYSGVFGSIQAKKKGQKTFNRMKVYIRGDLLELDEYPQNKPLAENVKKLGYVGISVKNGHEIVVFDVQNIVVISTEEVDVSSQLKQGKAKEPQSGIESEGSIGVESVAGEGVDSAGQTTADPQSPTLSPPDGRTDSGNRVKASEGTAGKVTQPWEPKVDGAEVFVANKSSGQRVSRYGWVRIEKSGGEWRARHYDDAGKFVVDVARTDSKAKAAAAAKAWAKKQIDREFPPEASKVKPTAESNAKPAVVKQSLTTSPTNPISPLVETTPKSETVVGGKGKEPWRADATYLTRESLPDAVRSATEEIVNNNPKLSENRAKELAAARIRNAIHAKVADIDDRAKNGNITDIEESWYDAIHVDGWSPTRDLEKMSGSRSIVVDADNPIANMPLTNLLEDNWTAKKEETEKNRKKAEDVERLRQNATKTRVEKSIVADDLRRKEKAERERENQVNVWFAKEGVGLWRGTTPEQRQELREKHVRQALAAGKDVPAAVLADYPDLAAKYAKKEGQPSPISKQEVSVGDVVTVMGRDSKGQSTVIKVLDSGKFVVRYADGHKSEPLTSASVRLVKKADVGGLSKLSKFVDDKIAEIEQQKKDDKDKGIERMSSGVDPREVKLMALYGLKYTFRLGDALIKGGRKIKDAFDRLFNETMATMRSNGIDTTEFEKKRDSIYKSVRDLRRAIRNPDGTVNIEKVKEAIKDLQALKAAFREGKKIGGDEAREDAEIKIAKIRRQLKEKADISKKMRRWTAAFIRRLTGRDVNLRKSWLDTLASVQTKAQMENLLDSVSAYVDSFRARRDIKSLLDVVGGKEKKNAKALIDETTGVNEDGNHVNPQEMGDTYVAGAAITPKDAVTEIYNSLRSGGVVSGMKKLVAFLRQEAASTRVGTYHGTSDREFARMEALDGKQVASLTTEEANTIVKAMRYAKRMDSKFASGKIDDVKDPPLPLSKDTVIPNQMSVKYVDGAKMSPREAVGDVYDSLRKTDKVDGAAKLAEFMQQERDAKRSSFFDDDMIKALAALQGKEIKSLTSEDATLLATALKHAGFLDRSFTDGRLAKAMEKRKANIENAKRGLLKNHPKPLATPPKGDKRMDSAPKDRNILKRAAVDANFDGRTSGQFAWGEQGEMKYEDDRKADNKAMAIKHEFEMQEEALNKSMNVDKKRQQGFAYTVIERVEGKGLTVADLITIGLYHKSKATRQQMYARGLVMNGETGNRANNFFPEESTIEFILNKKGADYDYIRAYVDMAHAWMNTKGKSLLNETSQELDGVDVATVVDYMRMDIDRSQSPNAKEREIQDLSKFSDFSSPESMGFLKKRTGSALPLVVRNGISTAHNHVKKVAAYHAFAKPVREFYAMIADEELGGLTRAHVGQKWIDSQELRYAAVTGMMQNQDGWISRLMRKLAAYRASFALGFNLGSAAKQITLAQAIALSGDVSKASAIKLLQPFSKEVFGHGKFYDALMSMPSMYERYKMSERVMANMYGEHIPEGRLGYMRDALNHTAFSMIQDTDRMITVRVLEEMYNTDENPHLNGSEDARMEWAKDKTDRLMRKWNAPASMLDVSNLSLKAKQNAFFLNLTFMAGQRSKMFNSVYEAYLKGDKKLLALRISNVVVNASASAAIGLLVKSTVTKAFAYGTGLLLGASMDDGDEEENFSKALVNLASDIGDMAVPMGGDLLRLAHGLYMGKSIDYLFEGLDSPLSGMTDASIDAFKMLFSDIKQASNDDKKDDRFINFTKSISRFIGAVAEFTGLPAGYIMGLVYRGTKSDIPYSAPYRDLSFERSRLAEKKRENKKVIDLAKEKGIRPVAFSKITREESALLDNLNAAWKRIKALEKRMESATTDAAKKDYKDSIARVSESANKSIAQLKQKP